jgi:sugar lactone lactonase YvrE
MARDEIRCMAPVGDRCGEAATWSDDDGLLYWCDVNRFLIHALDHRTGAVRSWYFDEPVAAIALTTTKGVLLVALGSRLILWTPETNARKDHGFRCEGWPRARFNDGRAGPNGEFWIGSMSNNVGPKGEANDAEAGLGELYCVATGVPPKRFKAGIGISNTVCWSPDGTRFYFGDTMENAIRVYDYGAGAISNERSFFAGFGRGRPDGSAMDSQGYLWNCRFDGGCIVRVAPSGKIDRVIEMPVRNITTCAFGGRDLRTLYITTASILGGHADRLAGSLFALDVDVPGLPAWSYRL